MPEGSSVSSLATRCEVLALLDALDRRLGARLRLGLRLFVLRIGPEQDVAGAHFLGRAHRLDLLVIDLAQRFVGHQRPRVVLQHQAHQELAAEKGLALLEVVGVLELARLGGLRRQHDVGDVADELLAPVLRRHLLELGAKVLLGHREVAFADIHAVDPGDHRIGRRAARRGRTTTTAAARSR